jgi:hypothetical protein
MPASQSAPGVAMNRCVLTSIAAAVFALGSLAVATSARADTLLIERVEKSQSMALPARGSSMADVEARYGAPLDKLEPRGGQNPQWPVINRWVYSEFTVYFEHTHVVNVVARKVTPGETGPKPVH